MRNFETQPKTETEAKKRETITLKGGGTITIEETKPGIFEIVDDNMTEKSSNLPDKYVWELANGLAFCNWDESVENLDIGVKESDVHMATGLSIHLKWEDVELTTDEIKAPSIERAREALSHIDMGTYVPDDI